MKPEEHRARHQALHDSLDELVADFISVTDKKLSEISIFELMEWSHKQSLCPDIPNWYKEINK